MIWLLILLFAVWYFFNQPQVSDETVVQKMIRQNPGTIAINTVSVDDNEARIIFYDPKTYAGHVRDGACEMKSYQAA